MPYVVRAHIENEKGDVQYWTATEDDAPYPLTWETEDEATEWMNGPEGDLFAEGCSMDTPKGYWLDDVMTHFMTDEEMATPTK